MTIGNSSMFRPKIEHSTSEWEELYEIKKKSEITFSDQGTQETTKNQYRQNEI